MSQGLYVRTWCRGRGSHASIPIIGLPSCPYDNLTHPILGAPHGVPALACSMGYTGQSRPRRLRVPLWDVSADAGSIRSRSQPVGKGQRPSSVLLYPLPVEKPAGSIFKPGPWQQGMMIRGRLPSSLCCLLPSAFLPSGGPGPKTRREQLPSGQLTNPARRGNRVGSYLEPGGLAIRRVVSGRLPPSMYCLLPSAFCLLPSSTGGSQRTNLQSGMRVY